jgi:flagellar protein FlaG
MNIAMLDSVSSSDKLLTGAAQTTAVSTGNAVATVEQTDTAITGVEASNKSDASKNTTEKPKDQKIKDDSVSKTDNTKLNFKVHKGTGEIMIQVIDNVTGEVIREIPPEKILDSIAEIWKNSGINVDKKV